MWSVSNTLLGRKTNKSQVNILEEMKKDKCYPREVLNEVNNTFINQCPEIAPDHFILNIDRNPQSIYFQPTDFNEVFNTITQLKNTSSTGKDGIPVKILESLDSSPILSTSCTLRLNFPQHSSASW
ncbi:hypothetical protein HHI36_022737 [Cryptolaemus montrouzieri]|uniref:Reverse transcriptase n=1 Tax=Cryptolaemus montrouzieri TaxID=559131 RepID=A0ABD2N0M7_9CUCU